MNIHTYVFNFLQFFYYLRLTLVWSHKAYSVSMVIAIINGVILKFVLKCVNLSQN